MEVFIKCSFLLAFQPLQVSGNRKSRREYVKIERGSLEREDFLVAFLHYPCGKFWEFSCFSLNFLDSMEYQAQTRLEKVCLGWEQPIEINPRGDFACFPSRLQHISQLILFPGHRSRCNWKSMTDWPPHVINFLPLQNCYWWIGASQL